MKKQNVYAIIGGGLGGATMAALLQKKGYNAIVFEQYKAFVPAGAGIHITPNAMKVMSHLGLENLLLKSSSSPSGFTSRVWDTGKILFTLPLNQRNSDIYDNSYITINRGVFHKTILSSVKPNSIYYGKKLKNIKQSKNGVTLYFEDGYEIVADYVIGADGLNSVVRQFLIGQSDPVFSGQIAFRSFIDASKLRTLPKEDLTKWWGTDRFVVSYYLNKSKSLYYFVAGMPADTWNPEAPSVVRSNEEMMLRFSGFHPNVQDILRESNNQQIWPIFERPSLPVWHDNRIVLLGDACHPMRPHMAQGAAMAIEDAAILFRCIDEEKNDDYEYTFKRYANARIARTAKVQQQSRENTWLKVAVDPTWLFAYDAINDPIEKI